MQDSLPSTSRGREPVLPLDREIQLVDDLREDFLQIIKEELDEASPLELRNTYNQAKIKFKQYIRKARPLKARLLEKGRISESETCRANAVKDGKDLASLKLSINALLATQGVSELALSVASSVRAWVLDSSSQPERGVETDQGSDGAFYQTAVLSKVLGAEPEGQSANPSDANSVPPVEDQSNSSQGQGSTRESQTQGGSPERGTWTNAGQTSSPTARNVNGSAVPTQSPARGTGHGNVPPGRTQAQSNVGSDVLHAMSRHLLQQDMLRDAIPTFKGDPMHFWSWTSSLKSYAADMSLNPLQTLKLMIRYTELRPKEYLEGRLMAVGNPTHENLRAIWSELTERHGSPHLIAAHLRQRVEGFPKINDQNDGDALLALYDLCETIEANMQRCPELTEMNHSIGLFPIRSKLPDPIQGIWAKKGHVYEQDHNVHHPPFAYFKEFLRAQAKQRSNHHYKIARENKMGKDLQAKRNPSNKGARALKTTVHSEPQEPESSFQTRPASLYCHFHGSTKHSLQKCHEFRKLSNKEKSDLAYQFWLCRRCLEQHQGEGCKFQLHCETCNKSGHIAAMCFSNFAFSQPKNEPKCIRICREHEGKNCSKTFLVDAVLEGHPKRMRGYVIVDDQSPVTLIDESVREFFKREFPTQEYTMHTACQGLKMNTVGQIISGLSVRGVTKEEYIPLPPSLSCKDLADTRNEAANPAAARRWSHAAPYAQRFPELDANAPMIALIGRDCPRAMWDHKVSKAFPYVVDSHLGFALVGQTCPSAKKEIYSSVKVKKTDLTAQDSIDIKFAFIKPSARNLDVFVQNEDDEEIGLSQNDKEFLSIVSDGVCVDEEGNLEIPLPLKQNFNLPNNASQVFKRTENTLGKLKRNPEKLAGCVQNIQRSIDSGYVEQVPLPDLRAQNVNSMPVHIATHPKKGKHRVVIDPTCNYKGGGLNDALLTGPNLINELNGVFLRFRESPIAFGADISDMFYNFKVPLNQRDLLRFFWFKDNDPDQAIVPYRNKSHPFGLSSSPGVSNFALRLCAMRPMTKEFESAQEYILHSFYVDDGLASTDTVEEGIRILANAQMMLRQYNVRLHKIMSNDSDLLSAFPSSDRAESPSRTLEHSSCQSVLGTTWNTIKDQISLNVEIPLRPFTKRGVLSCIGSIYDRSGLVSPVTLAGRLFQRKIMPPKASQGDTQSYGWDDELPQVYRQEYERWLESLKELNNIAIPRCMGPVHFHPVRRELHVFCDASSDCIGYVAYLRSLDQGGRVCVTFINASSKVAPRSANSIPRLELNAAVEAAANSAFLRKEMKKKPDALNLYTDSMIVMGYLSNRDKRFSKYVERRVDLVLGRSQLSEWHYVHTSENPADIATRSHTPRELLSTTWLTGPKPLMESGYLPAKLDPRQAIVLPEQKDDHVVLKTSVVKERSLTFQLCSKISRYSLALGTLKRLNNQAYRLDLCRQRRGMSLAPRHPLSPEQTLTIAIKEAQSDSYDELRQLLRKGSVPATHYLASLSPYLDEQGVIRIGGRLKNANLAFQAKHPIMLHSAHPFTARLAYSLHQRSMHPGSYLTYAALRQAGYYIEKGKGFIKKLVGSCPTCKRLRGTPLDQLMADLPSERLIEAAPFENIGLDVFGHFTIGEGRETRRHTSYRKVWVLICVCLPSRAIHLEPLPAMNTSAFMNAFTRFTAVRGPCKLVRSDQGSNFLGAINQMEGINVGDLKQQFLVRDIKWVFNPPQASHMGGSWERKIGSVRRVLEATFTVLGNRKLSYDEFTTILAEAAGVVNRTPLWTTSNDPNDPLPLTPEMILTMREDTPIVKEDYSQDDVLRYGKARYRRVQYLAEQFWTRWRNEYLLTLTERRKWKAHKPCIQRGDVVLIKERHARRNEWPMGRVTEIRASADGLIRSATIRLAKSDPTQTGRHVTRPLAKLVLLSSNDSTNSL